MIADNGINQSTLKSSDLSALLICVNDPPKSRFEILKKGSPLIDLINNSLCNYGVSQKNVDGGNSQFELDSEGIASSGEDKCQIDYHLQESQTTNNESRSHDETKILFSKIFDLSENIGTRDGKLENKFIGNCDSNVECPRPSNRESELLTSLNKRLNESYETQERLTAENVALERSKYQLEERILMKENECEMLQSQLDDLTNEMKALTKSRKAKEYNEQLSHKKMEGELNWLEKEMKRLGSELKMLKQEREEIKVNISKLKTIKTSRTLSAAANKSNLCDLTISNPKKDENAPRNKSQRVQNNKEELEIKFSEVKRENSEMRSKLTILEEAMRRTEAELGGKIKELEKTARSLTKVKSEFDRLNNESTDQSQLDRKILQTQIEKMESELTNAQAAVQNAYKQGQHVRYELQSEMKSLSETIEQGQKVWKGLQEHLEVLQSICSKYFSLSIPYEGKYIK